MQRELHTERLWLRAPRPGDEQAAFERWASDAALMRWMGWGPHTQREQTRQWLAWEQARWHKRSAFSWLLLPHAEAGRSPGPVGFVQLLPQRLDGPAHHLRLGYVLAADWQGRGLMREALAALLAHAFEQAEVWRVDAHVEVGNQRSCALLDALGLQREGCLHAHVRPASPDEAARDVWVYARWRGQ